MSADYSTTPADLPVPLDDRACSHLRGKCLPAITLPLTLPSSSALSNAFGSTSPPSLPSSSETSIDVSSLRKTVLFIYPATGVPGEALPMDWDAIPGARGCTPESLSFKNAIVRFASAGYAVVGMSAQSKAAHEEASRRLDLPYALISDADFDLTDAMRLPSFRTADGKRFMTRVTLVIDEEGKVAGLNYPIFPTSTAADRALELVEPAPACER